ncbi:TPA: glycosyltransferase family 2 protein [Campylobacter lari]|nr:glycosyltransferase family 2 protein [Campylobacter lari]
MTPKISIVMPVYNVEKHIKRSLESCINQTLAEIEIVIVDDCGTDSTMSIVNDYIKQDPRIKIVKNPENLKLLKTRFYGVKNCSSDYFIFLDADDFIDENICEICYNVFSKFSEIDMVVFNTNFQYNVDDEFQIVGPIKYSTKCGKNDFCRILLENKMHYYWSIWAKAYKKNKYIEMYEKHLVFLSDKIHMAEDCLAYTLYFNNIKYIQTINDALYYYCYNENSTMRSKNTKDTIISNIRDFESVIDILSHIKSYDFLFQEVLSRCISDLRCNLEKEKKELSRLVIK